MAYSTITDLQRWIDQTDLIQLCTTDAEATIASASVTGVVTEMIESADSEIDSYLLGRWPSLRSYSPAPPEINRLSAQIAVYNLYLRRCMVTDDWQTKYNACIKNLQMAEQGKRSLGLDDTGATASASTDDYQTDTDDDDRVFTESKLGLL